MTGPTNSFAEIDAGERRAAAKHLLSTPILTGTQQPAQLDLVRRHATELTAIFAGQLGYTLVAETAFARLVKAPLPSCAPLRPARRSGDGSAFTTATYVHLSLACAALLAPGVGEQILISRLVDQVRADAANLSITITDALSDRRQLVAALGLLISWGIISETDGSLVAWGERPEEEALLTINRALLVHLLPTPLHEFGTPQEVCSQTDLDDQPRRRLRRRLVESPAVFRAELPADELDVLSRERHELARQLEENFGLVLEVRAEGALAYDPEGALSDLEFPGSGSARQAALLLLDELITAAEPGPESVVTIDGESRPGVLIAWSKVDAALGELTGQYGASWRDIYVQSVSALRDDVVDILVAVRLAAPTPAGLAIFPFAARYQPRVVGHTTPQDALFEEH